MMDRPLPVGTRQGLALSIGNGNHRDLREFPIQRTQLADIQPAVERGDMRTLLPPGERKVQVIAMEVDDIETAGRLEYALQHQEMRG